MTVTVTQSYANFGGGVVAGGVAYDRRMQIDLTITGFGSSGGNPLNIINKGSGAFNMAGGGTAGVDEIFFRWRAKKRVITAVRLIGSGFNGTWALKGSQDGVTWSAALGTKTLTGTTDVISCAGNTTAYLHYKLTPTTNFTSMVLTDCEFEISGNQYEWGNRNTGSLVVPTVTFSISGGGTAAMMNGDLTANGTQSWWSGDPATGKTLQLDFADPVELLAIYSFDTGGPGSNNGTWKVQKWDGAAWVDVCAAKVWDMASFDGKRFDCTPTGTSTRYRMLGTAGNMNSGPFYQEFGFDITDTSGGGGGPGGGGGSGRPPVLIINT